MAGDSDILFNANKDDKYKCKSCKDTGYVISKGKVIKCPDCTLGTKGIFLDEEKVEQVIVDIIPEDYRDIYFDANKIRNDPRIELDIKNNPLFDYYLDSLTTIYNKITAGEKLNYSIMISAPQGLGKAHFVYACMNAGLKAGLSVAPYLDCLEIFDLINLISDSRYYDKAKQIESRELLKTLYEADVCFVKLPTGLTIRKDTTQTLKLLVDRRARRGNYTIAISRFPMAYIFTTEAFLNRFIITSDFGDAKFDYSRLRVIASPHPDYSSYMNRYVNNKNRQVGLYYGDCNDN